MRSLNKVPCIILILVLIVSTGSFIASCTNYSRNKSHEQVSVESIKKGQVLAGQYCQSCHTLPLPSMLNSASWEKGVLPNMGPRLGIFDYNFQSYPSNRYDQNLTPGYYPSQPIISLEDWQHIIDYYTATSPDSLPGQDRKYKIQTGLSLFTVQPGNNGFQIPATTCVKINEADSTRRIIVSDAFSQKISFYNNDLRLTDTVSGSGTVVNIENDQGLLLMTDIGKLNPNNGKYGKGEIININNGQGTKKILFDSLQRPVQVTAIDLNKDGRMDYLVCEFGYLTGALSWMENLGNNQFKRHVIRSVPGAIKVYIQDYNHDGLPDLWVLFAQADEGIFLFTNKGNGNFDQQEVLRFPPMNGSSSFELDDFNNDGYPDILYTCGDNADYSPVLKPYHGVYIFLNDKSNHFAQKYFFPINGCYKAIAKDFDGDGDLDIATISFFADYQHQPEESFVYLKNEGNYDFHPYTLPEAESGRWLTMDAGDIDGDGRPDLILGNFSVGPAMFKTHPDWKKGPPFLILRNTGK